MAVTNGWGQGAVNNTIDWGKGKSTATNDWGKVYDSSASGDTNITGSGGAVPFSNVYSVNMDGVDDLINCGNVTTFNGATNGSISAWFKSTSGGMLIAKYASGSTQFKVQFLSTRIDVYGASIGFRSTDTVTWLSGNWHHFVLSYDASRAANQRFQVYINTVLLTNLGFNGPTSLSSTTNDLLIGDAGAVVSHWSGNVDEVALFTTSLDATEVTALYNNGLPTDLTGHAGLANWWRMGDNNSGTGTTVTDQAGSNNGTLINSPTFQENVPVQLVSTKSIELDGVDDRVILANTTQNFTDFSLSFWCIRGGGNYKSIVGANSSSEGGILKAIVIAGNQLKYLDSTTGWTALTNTLSSTSWNHVLITYDSSSNTLKGYQDGSLITTLNPDFSSQSTNAHSIRYIGARYGTGFFNDFIDEVALWDSVISIGDVWDGGGRPTNLASTSPVHWWRCGDGDTAPTLTDNGSGGIDGTMTNFSTFSTNVPI